MVAMPTLDLIVAATWTGAVAAALAVRVFLAIIAHRATRRNPGGGVISRVTPIDMHSGPATHVVMGGPDPSGPKPVEDGDTDRTLVGAGAVGTG